MFRGRGFPQGRSRASLAVGGRGGHTIGAPACWTCGSTAHFSANCSKNLRARGGGRGPRNSGFRGGRSIASSRSGVRFAVFRLFGRNLARCFTLLMRANYYLISQKISKMNRLSKIVWKTYEALLVVQFGQDNAKKYVVRSLEKLGR